MTKLDPRGPLGKMPEPGTSVPRDCDLVTADGRSLRLRAGEPFPAGVARVTAISPFDTPDLHPLIWGLDDPTVLSRFEEAIRGCSQLHTEYKGKRMPAHVESKFFSLRDETIPRLRAELLEALNPKPVAVVEQDRETMLAERERSMIYSRGTYFTVRPSLDTQDGLRVFEAAFIRGYESGSAS